MEFTDALLQWYDTHKRALPWRGAGDAYAVLVSEVMLQQTRAAAVIPYYDRFMAQLPTVEALAACDEDRLLKLWEGLGYYSRARNLRKCAQAVVQEHGGRFPQTVAELRKLPGVGPYTAGAIASIAFGAAEPAVDGNVLRVMARLTEDGDNVTDPRVRDRWTAFLRDRMGARPGDLNQAFMDLGSLVCLPKSPLCGRCPLADRCGAFAHDTKALYPNRGERKSKRQESLTVFVIRCGDSFLIRRRPHTGLLSGLYELPNQKGYLDEAEIGAALTRLGVRPLGAWEVVYRQHIFTHVIWHMQVVRLETEAVETPGYLWYSGSEPMPEAFLKCMK
jgi:A/G-specific adenine glycosylase